MKKLIALLICLALAAVVGCTNSKKPAETPPPKTKVEADTSHLTAEDNGLAMSVSREVRSLSALNVYTKSDQEVVSVQVALENTSKASVPISPDFVTLKTSDGKEYKYSQALTDSITSKASFKKVTLPNDYRGGGLLIFEIKKGAQAQTLTYKDDSSHEMTIKFPSATVQTNI